MSQANVALIEQSWRTWEETGEPAWDLLDDEVETHDHDTPVERQDAIVYEIRDGKILRLDYYNNRQQALASVGMGA